MFEVGEETNENLVGRESSHFVVSIVALEQLVPQLGPLCFTGNHVPVVLSEPKILTSMRLGKEFFGYSSR